MSFVEFWVHHTYNTLTSPKLGQSYQVINLIKIYLPRKEVIQPQVLLQLPCYDFTPITTHTLSTRPPRGLTKAPLGTNSFRGVTGGVYKVRERIHRVVLIRDY